MTWSSVAKRGWSTAKSEKKVEKQVEKIDYWGDGVPGVYSVAPPTVEKQIKDGYEKMGYDVPKSVYGRPSPHHFGK